MLSYAKNLDPLSSKDLNNPDNMGYSAFIYDDKACVIREATKYKTVKAILTAISILLALLFIIGSPVTFVAVYTQLHTKMADPDRDLQYIIWGVAIVAFVVASSVPILIVTCLRFGLSSTTHYWWMYLIAYAFATVFTTASVSLGMHYIKQNGPITVNDVERQVFSDFPTPRAFIFCLSDQADGRRKVTKCLLIFVGTVSFTLLLVLSSFHSDPWCSGPTCTHFVTHCLLCNSISLSCGFCGFPSEIH